jgi:hypothetical protein
MKHYYRDCTDPHLSCEDCTTEKLKVYHVSVREDVRTVYEVEAESAEAARALWDEQGGECGPVYLSDCKSCYVETVTEG